MDSIVIEEPPSSVACGDGSGGGGGRAIDRHNPIIQDEKRLGHGRIFPSSFVTITDQSQSRLCDQKKPEMGLGGGDQKKKSVAFANDDPTSSSRCLLSDIAMSSFSSEFRHVSSSSSPPPSPSPPHEHLMYHNRKDCKNKDNNLPTSPPPPRTPQPPVPSSPPLLHDDLKQPHSPPHEPIEFHYSKAFSKKHLDSLSSATAKPLSPPHPPPPPSNQQVVVLEVALHCRGCERKMKKHISKIEGVTSFRIDFAAKKVTVVGDVAPLTVLTSVLKVKNAKLLTPATISSSSTQIGSNSS